MRSRQKEKILMVMLIDIIAMLAAFALALLIGHNPPVKLSLFSYYSWGVFTLFLTTLVIFFIIDLYSLSNIPDGFMRQMPGIALGLLLSSILVTFLFFFFRKPVPRAVFILFYCISCFFIIAFRYLLNRLTLSSVSWKILVVGEEGPSEHIARLINDRQYLRSRVVGYVSFPGECGAAGGLSCLGNCADLLSIVSKHGIDQIVVTTVRMDGELNRLLLECMRRKVNVSDFRGVMEQIAGKVPIDYLDDYWFILSLFHTVKPYFWYAKRAFDLVVSLIGLCLVLPLLPFIALLIKLDSRGPVFYSQQRIGRDSIPFRVWKLRTMVDDADKNNVHWTTDKDRRITRAGRFIRKTRLDEVPQLLNILKGEMSLIGPRPEAVSLVERYAEKIPYYRERHIVTPGITGWAQINYPYGNSIEDARQKLMYDFYYIKNRSVALDLLIFLRTIRTVLTGKGAL